VWVDFQIAATFLIEFKCLTLWPLPSSGNGDGSKDLAAAKQFTHSIP